MVKLTKLSSRAASLMAELERTAKPKDRRSWTADEIEFVRAAKKKGYTLVDIGKILKRTRSSVERQSRNMGHDCEAEI